MRILVRYPFFSPAALVFEEDGTEIYFGEDDGDYDHEVHTATTRVEPAMDRILLCLEPPLVEPWAYEVAYRRGFAAVLAYHGDGTTHGFRNPLPPLWPALPSVADDTPWTKRRNAVVAVMGNKHGVARLEPLLEVERQARRLGLGFDLYGRPPWDLPFYRGTVENKRAMLRQYRYCYCPENQSLPGYMSEKLPEALGAGCFPIYVGASVSVYRSVPWGYVSPDLRLETLETHLALVRAVRSCWVNLTIEMDARRMWQLVKQAVEEVG